MDLEDVKLSSHGLNWGTVGFKDGTLELMSSGMTKEENNNKRIMDIDLTTVEKVQTQLPLYTGLDSTAVGRPHW